MRDQQDLRIPELAFQVCARAPDYRPVLEIRRMLEYVGNDQLRLFVDRATDWLIQAPVSANDDRRYRFILFWMTMVTDYLPNSANRLARREITVAGLKRIFESGRWNALPNPSYDPKDSYRRNDPRTLGDLMRKSINLEVTTETITSAGRNANPSI